MRELSKQTVFGPVDYLFVLFDPIYRRKMVLALWSVSFSALVAAGYAIELAPINWTIVGSIVLIADGLVLASILSYLSISKSDALLGAD